MKDFKGYKTISMQEYITEYLNIHGSCLGTLLNANHYDLTELNIPGVKRVPNQLVTTEDIMRGSILLVEAKGSKNHGKMTCAYLRPELVLAEEYSTLQSEEKSLDAMIAESLYKTSTPLVNKRCLSKRI